ncbi:MAG: GspE/PulE family protein [Candidatus Wolfebacteria bacterium]|nr:GspE/PulE family protein [Candidatus Wolfebacteria bacterium]
MQAKKSVIDEKLAELRCEAEERDAERRAQKNSLPYLDAKSAPVNVDAMALISEESALKAKLAIIEAKPQESGLSIAVFDPALPETKEVLSGLETKGYKISLFVVSLSSLRHLLDFYKFVSSAQEKITGSVNIEESKLQEILKNLTSFDGVKKSVAALNFSETDTSNFLEVILAGALFLRASDIHLEPEETVVKFRLRIDGLLHDVLEVQKTAYSHLLSRIKLLSELKLNVHGEPQDGRFSIKLSGKEIEVRVAVAPVEFGEVIVMRLLDPDAININLKELGLRADDLEIIEKELIRPNGMILNTGPTGSGKTTTLYAFLKHKQNSEIKIITIEDPIEYKIHGIEQTQVDEESGYGFADGLKSLMRQDPDVLLVGEIRDKETAEIGIQAALTGHLVFSTVHANEAAGAIPRLLDLGVRPTSIGPAVNMIIGQRLVRRLCGFCKIKDEPSEDLKNKIKKFLAGLPQRVKKEDFKEVKVFKRKGCDKCNGFGYKGRTAIYELMPVGAKIEEMINKDTGEATLQEYAIKNGMVTMQFDGILKVISGETTFDEVESATGPIEWEDFLK